MSGDASTPVSAARAIPRRFVPPTPPPTPADSLGTAGLLRPPLLAGSMPYRTGSGSPSPGQSPLSSRYVPVNLLILQWLEVKQMSELGMGVSTL